MTDEQARTAADLVLAAAGIAVAYVILTKRPLRRLAFQAMRYWLGASVPVFIVTQARQAWVESGRHA
jgi:hypothetical protein